MLFFILIAFMLIGFIVQQRLKGKFKKYSKMALSSSMTGRKVAEQMLADNNIHDVRVTATPGKLTDHYNPANKTVNLSQDVYNGSSVAAAAVASHECGHAVQHATGYSWLQFRSAMVPVVSFSSKAINIIFLLMLFGMGIAHLFPFDTVIWVMIILQGAITLFTVVTLPVEYDASNRALAWLESSGSAGHIEHTKAKDALNAAANTYLVAALASITQLAYYVMLLLGRD
ncbi:MAG: zinc metallopeptidase [Owenweeksia sp.]|nr:zinc metallopeptidase [Owenweeksia sp.]